MTSRQGVVALLDDHHNGVVNKLWQDSMEEIGEPVMWEGAIPHVTLHASKGSYDLNALKHSLTEFGHYARPFDMQANGLGIFTSLNPILHVPIVRTADLNRLQELLWVSCASAAASSEPYYHPENWIPHITIASLNTNKDRITRLVGLLADSIFFWNIKVTELAVLERTDTGSGLLFKVKLGPER